MSLIQRTGLTRDCSDTPDDWFTPRRFAIMLGILVLAAYPDVVLGWRTFSFRDFGFFGYPLANYHRESFWRGEIPLWNPLSNCGLPFLAQWNTLVLYPGSLLYLLFPVSWAVGMFCLGHLVWAGLGMYFLALRWTGNRFAASVAGVAFAINGLTLNALMWPNNIAALGWMPWVVLVVHLAWLKGGQWIVAAAIVGAIQMLTGAPEINLFTWALIVAICLADVWSVRASRTRVFSRLAVTGLLAAGLSAVQLMPFFELLKHSQRTSSYVDAGWSMPGTGWANFLVPLFRTFMSNRGVYFQYDQYWTSSYFVGISVVALAIYAVWRVGERRVLLLATLSLLALVLALGDAGYLHHWLRTILPQVGFMRYPIKYVVPVGFCFPLLAAFAVGYLRRPTMEQSARAGRDLKILGAVLCVITAVIVWFAWSFPVEDENWLIAGRNALARVGFLAAILCTLQLLQKKISPRANTSARLALLTFLFLDVMTHAPRQNPTIERTVMEPGVLTARQMNPLPRHGHSRAMLTPEADQKLRLSASSIPRNDYLINRLGLFSNCNLLEGIPKVNGFFSLYLREAEDIYWLIYGNTNRSLPALYDFLSVSQTTRPAEFFEWQSRDAFLPMATVGMKPLFADDAIVLNELSGTNFNPRKLVFISADAKSFVSATKQSQAKILDSRFTAHEANIEVEASAGTVLVVSQTHYHPWRAYVDGQPEKILRANHAFQAVQVPAGRHPIKLIYEDTAFHWGALVSTVTLAVCLTVRFVTGRKRMSQTKLDPMLVD